MARRGRNRLLVPQVEEELNLFKTRVMNHLLGTHIENPDDVKLEVAKQLDIPLEPSGNGDIKAEQAGKVGGVIGGNMVKEMIRLVQMSMVKKGEQEKH
jgi:hypothetical protein